VLLLTIVGVEFGGWFILRVLRGQRPATPFQQAFFRAGHAHAGVLVILGLVSQILVSAAHVTGVLGLLTNGIWAAAILMSAGFFLSAAGKDVTQPNRFIVVLYVGAASLAVGVVALGLALLTG
jgi:hypothetical protein